MEHGQELQTPDWMSCLPAELLDVPLWNLAIPGSHDSMSFCLDLSSPVLGSEPVALKVLEFLFPCFTRPCIYRWATTQEALSELAVWLDAHPKEIVIISCSHFEGMTDTDHMRLAEDIITLFGKKLCPHEDIPTLHSCWSRQHQVIVSYENDQMVQQHPELWDAIPYWYADSPDPKKVVAYLEEQKHRQRPAGFYVSGLNLTEDITYVLLHPYLNMRKLTMRSLSLLLKWTSEQSPGKEDGAVNIVCCDFVDVSHFCSLVIGLNYKLLGFDNVITDYSLCR
ncbi:PI-PLC X domain-containing protein 1 isoform X3 [Cynoglossus semilaevis]|uniref:PI-PLC X domain-containing protein 1 isoform X3 n=1 Tax=Cynoglossus semilaevis TaxID=244447 RepID=UPI0007DCA101|nr:PI-PLC X domain-containing protein 1-like isoform X3 [Cynoglossus semilaevis]